MKMTLAQLKREAHIWEWLLLENSWYQEVPEFQKAWRKVGSKNSVGFTLLTHRDGEMVESHIDWPKSSEIEISSCLNHPHWIVQITRKCGDRPDHVMIYRLRPNLDLLDGVA